MSASLVMSPAAKQPQATQAAPGEPGKASRKTGQVLGENERRLLPMRASRGNREAMPAPGSTRKSAPTRILARSAICKGKHRHEVDEATANTGKKWSMQWQTPARGPEGQFDDVPAQSRQEACGPARNVVHALATCSHVASCSSRCRTKSLRKRRITRAPSDSFAWTPPPAPTPRPCPAA